MTCIFTFRNVPLLSCDTSGFRDVVWPRRPHAAPETSLSRDSACCGLAALHGGLCRWLQRQAECGADIGPHRPWAQWPHASVLETQWVRTRCLKHFYQDYSPIFKMLYMETLDFHLSCWVGGPSLKTEGGSAPWSPGSRDALPAKKGDHTSGLFAPRGCALHACSVLAAPPPRPVHRASSCLQEVL